MEHFNNSQQSHEHSLETLNLIYGYDSFLDSISTVCDMGCGAGRDTHWWATLETRDDPPEPRSYMVYAVDRDTSKIEPEVREISNVKIIENDFEEFIIPVKIDLLWSHDSFNYALNPMKTLSNWNRQMNQDGMLVMILPQHSGVRHNRLFNNVYSHRFYNYNISSLTHMLAISGFDCHDAYMCQTDNWLKIGVYKISDPLDPHTTTLYDLADLGRLNKSAVESVNKFGYLRQEDLIYPWLDKDFKRFL